ncbi:acid phosphatase 1-like [Phoenix dactylifera]|uniref:Acid phosphatase 1-like n=1 Tax=Phoenix dactylifera TaxID=42345 RepID=A0A8B7CLN5_PHODC|nr:acid phosphatase 1-like [Phoenix dactylifera]
MKSSYLLLLAFSTIATAYQTLDPLVLPRPLILEYPPGDDQIFHSDVGKEEVQLRCASWRFAGEANNLAPWKTVPADCGAYVKDYMTGKAYRFDLEMVADEAAAYARSVSLAGDCMDAWVFDVDETLLSNLPYYADHGYGLEVFSSHEFDKWVDKAMAPAIQSSLKLYEEILRLGFKIFLLTGRTEGQKIVTMENLKKVGFRDWKQLILRGVNDHGRTATMYKSEKRSEIVANGYRILGNSGDQWSDLLGSSMGNRSFKLPNPMYYIP